MHLAPLCSLSLGQYTEVADMADLLALPTLQEASLTVYDMDDSSLKSLPPKLTLVWNSWRHQSLPFYSPYASVRDLTLHARLHKHPDFRLWTALRRLTLINGTVEFEHFPPALEALALHGVAVVTLDDESYFSENERCSRAETVVLRHTRLEAWTFNRMFDAIRHLTIANADAFTVSELVRASGRASDRASEKLPRVLDQVTLMRPFPRFTKRLLGALAKLKQLVLVEPHELSADERLLAVRAAPSVILRGVRKRDRAGWIAVNPKITFQ